ncbi:hypothetical protein ISN74_01290 [Dyella caseinilytica]|uniref:DUF3857 domain-containing protein n=1 Tax=Dyella caseinilytica TaxID=1849581 RepID=A0ABX7GYW2_9GAMM|nr:hypothetical protein ISN74_01290 [Dyella caseinilytica]
MCCFSAYAQSVEAPDLKAGDSWVVADTIEQGTQGWVHKNQDITVERIQSDGMLIATKEEGSNQPPIERITGLDWSRSRDINGKQEVVNRPFNFPLKPGKKWTVEYTELNPNQRHSSETLHCDYVVTGWEDVQVAAGSFKAIKVECDGQWTAVMAPAVAAGSRALVNANGVTTVTQTQRVTPRTFSGRLYDAFWYVPSQKRFVKSVEEYYSSNGVRSQRFSEELVSSKVAN